MWLTICGMIASIIGLFIFNDALYMSYVIGLVLGGLFAMIGLALDGDMK